MTSTDGTPAARPPRPARSIRPDQLRLLATVARMYHERGIPQPQIAADLHISQSRVSRLLRRAEDVGIVRTVVTLPPGVHTDLEEQLRSAYGLSDAVVVDTDGSAGAVIPALGAATATYLDETLTGGDTIGLSSWSETLLSAVDIMQPKKIAVADYVVQLFGGVGNPAVQVQATRLLSRLASNTGAEPIYMPTPSLVSTTAVRDAVMQDTAIEEVAARWDRLTLTLVGIGSLEPSTLLQRSGNAVADSEGAQLRELGAVGDICLRFFDKDGRPISSPFDNRVLGITAEQLARVARRIGVAGGPQKQGAIHAAVAGGWINILITDVDTARELLRRSPQGV